MTQTPSRPAPAHLPIGGRPNLMNRPDLARQFLRDLIGNVPGWDGTAACASADPEAWFPKKGENPQYAKKICAGCEIRTKCLEGALARGEKYGIWAGQSEKTLARMRKPR